MTWPPLRDLPRYAFLFASLFLLLSVSYFYGLSNFGLLGPDEPRYAEISREMVRSGDWVTPRLWGKPWFEKPPLLYWMEAIGFRAGWGLELAPRLPVALLSVAFLLFFLLRLWKLFDRRVALFSTVVLASSAGWVAFSHAAVPDLPLAASFSAAMLLLDFPVAAGFFLGIAILAKGLVPLVLFLPALWFRREEPRRMALLLGVALVIATPWYALATARNGMPFLQDFIWKQHFSRFTSPDLQHVRPFWFYIPVFLLGLFPWTPALTLLTWRRLSSDAAVRFYAVWFAWGFVFFSVSRNKLPGYLLPLLPAACILIGIGLARAPRSHVVLALCALGFAFYPTIREAVAHGFTQGLSTAPLRISFVGVLLAAALASLCLALEAGGLRMGAVGLIAVMVAVGITILYRYDISPRVYWMSAHPICLSLDASRSVKYVLSYYAGVELPVCPAEP